MKKSCVLRKTLVVSILTLFFVLPSAAVFAAGSEPPPPQEKVYDGKIAGHNVIYVHGFDISDLATKPSDEDIYNSDRLGGFWTEDESKIRRMNWSAAHRVEGHISEQIMHQAIEIADEGFCDGGCVIVSESTGDQVTRHFLANQERWMRNAGREPLNIVATIDFVGAGGGTEVANLITDLANCCFIPQILKDAAGFVVGMVLDFDISDLSGSGIDPENLGVVNDLTFCGARNLATANNDVPRLRVSAGKFANPILEPHLAVINAFLQGADDTLIPAHSSCGASSPDPIDSCSSCVTYQGKRTNVKGPAGLMMNHFPVLMANNYGHGDVTNNNPLGEVTYVNNDFSAGLDVSFDTYTKQVTRNWWELWIEDGTWQYVTDWDTKSLSRLVFENLDE